MYKLSNKGLRNRRKFLKDSTLLGCSALMLGTAHISCIEEADGATCTAPKPTGYRISTAGSAVKIMPNDVLPERKVAKLAMAANEYQSFQIVIRSETDINDVRVNVHDLVNGNHRIVYHPWYQVGYVYIGTFAGHPADGDVSGKLPGWYPDPLLERDHLQLIKGWSNSIWITLYAPPGTPPGTYEGAVEIAIGQQTEVVQVAVKLYSFALPAVPSLPSLFPLSLGYLVKVYTGLPQSIRKNWLDFLADHRICATDIYLNPTGPEVEYRITASEYKSYQHCTNGFVIYPITTSWEDRTASADELIKRFEASRDYIDSILSSGAANNGKGMFYGFDECEPEHFDTMKKVHRHIKACYPDIPIATTSMHIRSASLLDELGIDILILHITDGLYDQILASEIRTNGKKVWAYISLQPYYPMPNWRIENAPLDARVLLSAMAYHEQFDGFLYWCVNQYNKGNQHAPSTISRNADIRLKMSITTPADEYKWLHGDGLLIYPGETGPISSIRMENIREGLQEYTYYKLVESKYGQAEAMRLAADMAPNMINFCRDELAYQQHKAAIADMLDTGI